MYKPSILRNMYKPSTRITLYPCLHCIWSLLIYGNGYCSAELSWQTDVCRYEARVLVLAIFLLLRFPQFTRRLETLAVDIPKTAKVALFVLDLKPIFLLVTKSGLSLAKHMHLWSLRLIKSVFTSLHTF